MLFILCLHVENLSTVNLSNNLVSIVHPSHKLAMHNLVPILHSSRKLAMRSCELCLYVRCGTSKQKQKRSVGM